LLCQERLKAKRSIATIWEATPPLLYVFTIKKAEAKMIKRKHTQEPFESVAVDKHAFDMSNVKPERLRKEIKEYLESLYPFMAAGLQYVNFKKSPDADGNAVGSIDYNGNGVNITIPIILEEHNLKEPTLGIYDNRIVPLDKEYLDYIVDYPEYGEQVKENELPANMQYIMQSGLFQSPDSGVYKSASKIVGTIFDEDACNPYHYYGTILKRAADHDVTVEEGVYCESAEMLSMLKEANDANKNEPHTMIGKDERLNKAPVVRKITDSGVYRNVFIGGEVCSACVMCDAFSVVPGEKVKSLVFAQKPYGSELDSGEEHKAPEWGYGEAMGSGYADKINHWEMGGEYYVDSEDPQGCHIFFIDRKPYIASLGSNGIRYSTPYYVERDESLNYGDDGKKVRALLVKDMEKASHMFIISEHAAEVRKIDGEKLKENGLGHLYEENLDYYLVPATHEIKEIKGKKVPLTTAADGYRDIVEKVSEDYPNTMILINKGANLHTVTVSDSVTMRKHADVSSNGALLLANYYTGSEKSNISEYVPEHPYQFSGDITKKAANRAGLQNLSEYRGEFRKLAEHIKAYVGLDKVADIGATVDKLVGVETSIDDEWMDTNNVLHLMDNVISKIAELLLMARLGKNDISESILGRAMYAIVKLSNDVRGASSKGSY
jgi:hypothetical protein